MSKVKVTFRPKSKRVVTSFIGNSGTPWEEIEKICISDEEEPGK